MSFARSFADSLVAPDVVGIVLLGAVARGYFDTDSDVDIAVFREGHSSVDILTRTVEGFEVQTFVAGLETERTAVWPVGKRWAYTTRVVHYDPTGALGRLLDEKVPLSRQERRLNAMTGIALSDWYCRDLPEVWVRRGNLAAAHHVLTEGLDQYLLCLFALNDQLLPDAKWRLHLACRLPWQPEGLEALVLETLRVSAFSHEELDRRRAAFTAFWEPTLHRVEAEIGVSYEEFRDTI